MKKAKEMTKVEFQRWFAFMNMVKFSSHYAKLHNLPKDFDMPWRAQLDYIDEVSGDIGKHLEEKNGVPFKYSLNLAHEEAKFFEELQYN